MHAPALVLGAAGYLGLNLVDALIERGVEPLCGRRARTNTIVLRKRKMPMVIADLDDPDGLREAMRGVRTVFHAAGYYPRHSQHPDQSIETATRQMRHALDAAAAAGVERMVYVSSTATVAPRDDGGASTEDDVFESPPGWGLYHDLKWATERMALVEDRFEVVVACPGACIGPWDLRLGTTAVLAAAAHGKCPALPDGLINAVHTADVAAGLIRMAELASPPKRALLVGSTRRLHDVLSDYAAGFGAPKPALAPSVESAIAAADAEEQRVLGTAERPLIVRELVDLIAHAVDIDPARSAATLDLHWTPLATALADFTAWARRFRIVPNETQTNDDSTDQARR